MQKRCNTDLKILAWCLQIICKDPVLKIIQKKFRIYFMDSMIFCKIEMPSHQHLLCRLVYANYYKSACVYGMGVH